MVQAQTVESLEARITRAYALIDETLVRHGVNIGLTQAKNDHVREIVCRMNADRTATVACIACELLYPAETFTGVRPRMGVLYDAVEDEWSTLLVHVVSRSLPLERSVVNAARIIFEEASDTRLEVAQFPLRLTEAAVARALAAMAKLVTPSH